MAAIPTALFTRSLGIGRIIAGIGPIVAPATAARRMGMSSTAEEPEAQVWSQLFGSRDVVLGALLLGAKDPAVRRAVAYVGGMTDRFAFETAVELLGWRRDRLPRPA